MDPVKQQLRLLGQNRPLRAMAIASGLVEAFGDDADTLMLEGLALLADRQGRLTGPVRERLEQAVLVGWERLSIPAKSLARRQYQSSLRRALERAAEAPSDGVRRKAVDLARALATERDQSAWEILRGALNDAAPAIVRAAAEAIAHAAGKVGVRFPGAEPAIIAALDAFARHRTEGILLLVAEQADQVPSGLAAWLAMDAGRSEADEDGSHEIAQHAMRSAAKRLPASVVDRLIPVWLGLPCLSPVAVRRLQQGAERSVEHVGKGVPTQQGWANLLAAVPAEPSPAYIDALKRIGPEAVADAVVALSSSPLAVRLVMHACRNSVQREAAAIRLLMAREPAVRLMAVRYLAGCAPSAASDVALAGLAYEDEPSVACAAVGALARFSSPNRHVKLDAALLAFAEHGSPAVRRAAAMARRLTDPVGDIVATAQTPARQAMPWRAPIGVRGAVARDAATIARSLQRIATDPQRPASLRRTARLLLNRALPLPPRVPERSGQTPVAPAAPVAARGGHGA